MYVLSSQTRGSKSLGSATDANVNMYRNPRILWSVVWKKMRMGHRWSLPWFHPVKASAIDSLFVHHVFPSSNCPLHERAPFPSIFLQDRILGVSGTPFALRGDSGHCGAPLLRDSRYHPLSPGQSFSIGQTVSVVRESGHGGAPSFHLIYINRR